MPENFRALIGKAVRSAHDDENRWIKLGHPPFNEDQAAANVLQHLEDDYVETNKGKSEPLDNTLVKVRDWAANQYFVLLLNDLRREGNEFRDHTTCMSQDEILKLVPKQGKSRSTKPSRKRAKIVQ